MTGSLFQDLRVYQVYVEGRCKITAKELLESSDEDGTTYAPHFEYQVLTGDDQSYSASGYYRTTVYSSGRRGKEEILARYKVEGTYPCWYNPDDPTQVVLARGLSWGWGYLFIFLPLIFVGIGIWGISSSVMGWGKSPEAAVDQVDVNEAVTEWLPDLETEPGHYLDVRLPVQSSHGKSVLGMGFMALFWNGIVSIFVIIGLTQDDFPILVWLFLIPFILVGLFLIYTLFRQLLTWLTAGETLVEISDEPLQLGQKVDVFVRQKGRKPIQEVQVKLVCQEHVTYRQGTDTRTDDYTVYEVVLFEQANFAAGAGDWQQTMQTQIPSSTPHSFAADNNEIRWFITVAIKVAEAPDFELSFPVRVVPSGLY